MVGTSPTMTTLGRSRRETHCVHVQLSKSVHAPSASGVPPEDSDGTRVPYSATGGGRHPPRKPFEGPPREPHGDCGSQDLTVRWLPFGTRVRRFLFPMHTLASRSGPGSCAGPSRSHLEPDGGQRDHAIADALPRADAPSLPEPATQLRDLPSRRRSSATLGVGTDVPSQAGDAGSMRARGAAGIRSRAFISRMVNGTHSNSRAYPQPL